MAGSCMHVPFPHGITNGLPPHECIDELAELISLAVFFMSLTCATKDSSAQCAIGQLRHARDNSSGAPTWTVVALLTSWSRKEMDHASTKNRIADPCVRTRTFLPKKQTCHATRAVELVICYTSWLAGCDSHSVLATAAAARFSDLTLLQHWLAKCPVFPHLKHLSCAFGFGA